MLCRVGGRQCIALKTRKFLGAYMPCVDFSHRMKARDDFWKSLNSFGTDAESMVCCESRVEGAPFSGAEEDLRRRQGCFNVVCKS